MNLSHRARSRVRAVGGIASVLAAAVLLGGCNKDPGEPEVQPNYRYETEGEPTTGERGNMLINEVNYAGSVTDDGTRDADDVFIELWNKNPRPVNVSGWRLIVSGDYENTYRIPAVDEPVSPNDHFVIARKKDGAFGDVADVFIEDLELGTKLMHIELRDQDRHLQEGAGSKHARVFMGGYDTVTVRSMERAQLIFGNSGTNARNWHAYSSDLGLNTIREGWREKTLASPGEANSPDYSGNTSSGNFE